jgi:hypothetical protein
MDGLTTPSIITLVEDDFSPADIVIVALVSVVVSYNFNAKFFSK